MANGMRGKAPLSIVVLVAIALGGCGMAPVGPYNGFSKDPMSKIIVVKYPAPGGTPYPTKHEWKIVKQMADTCQLQINPQLSSPGETVGATAAMYGVAGGLGIGLGAEAFPGAIFHRYFTYGGIAGAFSGVAYGITLWSYNDVSVVGSCTRDFVRRAGLKDIYVYPAYVRAKHGPKQISPDAPTLVPEKQIQKQKETESSNVLPLPPL